MEQVAGYLLLAIVVVLYLVWEWQLSAPDRQRRLHLVPPREIYTLPSWKLWFLAAVHWVASTRLCHWFWRGHYTTADHWREFSKRG